MPEEGPFLLSFPSSVSHVTETRPESCSIHISPFVASEVLTSLTRVDPGEKDVLFVVFQRPKSDMICGTRGMAPNRVHAPHAHALRQLQCHPTLDRVGPEPATVRAESDCWSDRSFPPAACRTSQVGGRKRRKSGGRGGTKLRARPKERTQRRLLTPGGIFTSARTRTRRPPALAIIAARWRLERGGT